MDSWIRPGTSVNLTGFRSSPAFLEISNLISISFSGRSSLKRASRWLFFRMGQPRPLLFICVLFKQKFNRKTVGVSGIRTWIIGVEGEKADHLTTTTAKSMIIANRNLMIGWQGNIYHEQNVVSGAVIVAQLVEQSLPTPEVRCSNLVISYFYVEHMFTVNCYHIFSENFKKLWSHWLWAIL